MNDSYYGYEYKKEIIPEIIPMMISQMLALVDNNSEPDYFFGIRTLDDFFDLAKWEKSLFLPEP